MQVNLGEGGFDDLSDEVLKYVGAMLDKCLYTLGRDPFALSADQHPFFLTRWGTVAQGAEADNTMCLANLGCPSRPQPQVNGVAVGMRVVNGATGSL